MASHYQKHRHLALLLATGSCNYWCWTCSRNGAGNITITVNKTGRHHQDHAVDEAATTKISFARLPQILLYVQPPVTATFEMCGLVSRQWTRPWHETLNYRERRLSDVECEVVASVIVSYALATVSHVWSTASYTTKEISASKRVWQVPFKCKQQQREVGGTTKISAHYFQTASCALERV